LGTGVLLLSDFSNLKVSVFSNQAMSSANSVVVFSALPFYDEISGWLMGLEDWQILVVVSLSAIIALTTIAMLAVSIMRLFSNGKNSKYDVNDSGNADYSHNIQYEAVPLNSQYAHDENGNQLYLGVGLDTQMQQVPQIETMYTPDMASAIDLAPTVRHGDAIGLSDKGRLSNETLDRLGFDINTPFISETPSFSMTDERKAKQRIEWLEQEKKVILQRLAKLSDEHKYLKSSIDTIVSATEKDIADMQSELEELDRLLHKSSKKEKARIREEMSLRNEAVQNAHMQLNEIVSPNNSKVSDLNILASELENLNTARMANEDELVKAKADQKIFEMIKESEKPERDKRRKDSLSKLKEIMHEANEIEVESDNLENRIERRNQEKKVLVAENSAVEFAILSTSDLDKVLELSQKISNNNQVIVELDRMNNADMRARSSKPVSLRKLKREASDIIEDLDLTYDEIVREEDQVLVSTIKSFMMRDLGEKKRFAQDEVLKAQGRYEILTDEYHRSLTDASFSISNAMRDADTEFGNVKAKLQAIDDKLAVASGAEAAMLNIERLTVEDALQVAEFNLERAKAQTIKDRLTVKSKLDDNLAEAQRIIDLAVKEYENLILKEKNIDLEAHKAVVSGSGVICKMRREHEKNEKEKENKRVTAQENFNRRKLEIESEKKRLNQNASLDAQMSFAMEEDVAKAQNGDIDARNRLEQSLLARMSEDEKQYFFAMRPDEKWRFIMMEIEEIVRRSQQQTKESLARIEAEEKALQAQLEADARVRELEEAAELAQTQMDEQTLQAQVDAELFRLQSIDSAANAKEKAEKYAEEIMRAAQEERQRAHDLVQAVKKRALESQKQVEEIVRYSKISGESTSPSSVVQAFNLTNSVETDENISSTIDNFDLNKSSDNYIVVNGSSEDYGNVNGVVNSMGYMDVEIAEANRDLATAQAEMDRLNAQLMGIVDQTDKQEEAERLKAEQKLKLENEFMRTELERQKSLDDQLKFVQQSQLDMQRLLEEQKLKEEKRLYEVEEQQKLEQIKIQSEQEISRQVEQMRRQLQDELQTRQEAERVKAKGDVVFAEEEIAKIAMQERDLQNKLFEQLELEREQLLRERERANQLIQEANHRAEVAEQNSKLETERAISKMEQEFFRLRQEFEKTTSIQEVEQYVSAIEAKAKEEVNQANKRAENAENIAKQHREFADSHARQVAEEIASVATKQAQDAKEEAAKAMMDMEKEILRVRHDMEDSKKAGEIETYVSVIESKAREEVNQAIKRAEQAEALARQHMEYATEQARKVADAASAIATKQAQDAKEEAARARADMEQELMSVRQEIELSKKENEVAAYVATIEAKAQEEVNLAIKRAEQAEQFAKQQIADATEKARKVAETASSQAAIQAKSVLNEASRTRSDMEREIMHLRQEIEGFKKQNEIQSYLSAVEKKAQEEVSQAVLRAEQAEEKSRQQMDDLKSQFQREMQELRALHEEDESFKMSEYEHMLMSEKQAALERAEKAEQALRLAEMQKMEIERLAHLNALDSKAKELQVDKSNSDRVAHKVAAKKAEIAQIRVLTTQIKTEADLKLVLEKLNILNQFLDEDERSSNELIDMIARATIDARHAGEMAVLRNKLEHSLAGNQQKPVNVNISPRRSTTRTIRTRAARRPISRLSSRMGSRMRSGTRPIRMSDRDRLDRDRYSERPISRGYRRPPE
jgi:hypothetical protein